ncbi:MAG: LysM peptidoglycan-binding domain-containing protein [Anaerolineae bacterium]|jgi:LysM repeat protein
METEDILQTLPKRPARHCPVCGARVAEEAKVCLMCGATLEEEPEVETPPPSAAAPQRMKTVQIIIMAVVAVVILAGSVMLGLRLTQEQVNAPAELPTFTPTQTGVPTFTPTATRTATPTLTPTPQSTATPQPPQTYSVQSGDTLGGIAVQFDITVEELKAFNNLDSDDIGAGQSLLIPPPTPTPGPTPTLDPGEPTLTPAPYLVYTVRTGDTLSTIAENYPNVSVDDIRRANNIPEGAETIRTDQVLVIPQYTPTPQPETIAVIGGGTPTPVMAYSAPEMLYPPDNATFTGPDAAITLQWASTGLLTEKEFYKLEFIIPTAEGKTTINVYQRSTAWRVPEDLFPTADIEDRDCAWRVSVVRQVTSGSDPTYKVIGLTGRRRTFIWDVAAP